MGSMSYFEIGGHIVECNNTSIPSSSRAPPSFRGAPTNTLEGSTPRNQSVAGGRKGAQPMAYTPYSYGNPLVWAATQVLLRIAQKHQKDLPRTYAGSDEAY